MKANAAAIAIVVNPVAPGLPAATAALAADAVPVVPVDRERVVGPKARGAKVVHLVVGLVPAAVDFPAMTGANRWNGANRRSHCRKSTPRLCPMKRASNPWRDRSR
jgi:hypothetical protein